VRGWGRSFRHQMQRRPPEFVGTERAEDLWGDIVEVGHPAEPFIEIGDVETPGQLSDKLENWPRAELPDPLDETLPAQYLEVPLPERS
jgi:hypothetical protein